MFMDKKKTFDFASIWLMRFESRELSRFQFEDLFGEDCRELGFEMDCAHEFEEQYPGCFNLPNEKLDGVPQSGSLVAKFSNVHEKNPPVISGFEQSAENAHVLPPFGHKKAPALTDAH